MNSFKLLGIRFSQRNNKDNPSYFRFYATDDMTKPINHIWYMTYSDYSSCWVVRGLKFVTILSDRKPIRLRFNGCDTDILYLSKDEAFVKEKADLYNSYNQALA